MTGDDTADSPDDDRLSPGERVEVQRARAFGQSLLSLYPTNETNVRTEPAAWERAAADFFLPGIPGDCRFCPGN